MHNRFSAVFTFQSTPSTRRETGFLIVIAWRCRNFNPLPPHGGRRNSKGSTISIRTFQSTPSTRRETTRDCASWTASCISIHSLHTEGDARRPADTLQERVISIHSLHTEGDNAGTLQSAQHGISIHSLHTEGDVQMTCRRHPLPHFNPLPPHGGRHAIPKPSVKESTFQSTPSTRRETCRVLESVSGKWISIHSLHTEGDMTDLFTPSPGRYFNPLPPHGGRPALVVVFPIVCAFQSTPSTRRET